MPDPQPDFESLAAAHLTRLPISQRKDVACELAGHLEQRYHELLASGLTAPEAERQAITEAGDWKKLERQIIRARREDMTQRAKTILIPGIVAFLISGIAEKLLWWIDMGPAFEYQAYVYQNPYVRTSWTTHATPMLLCLIIAGMAAALCSREAGGSTRDRILAAELPMVFPLFTFLMGVVITIFNWQNRISILLFLAFNLLLPAAALLLGAAPVAFRRPKPSHNPPGNLLA